MSPPPQRAHGDNTPAAHDRDIDAPMRRAPFSDNPTVGVRGLRTQQRILDAALSVLGDHGYERTTIEQIAERAGCSRVSVYQYFASKEDVFRHLAGQVARQLRVAAEVLEPVTPDTAGWTALRGLVSRYGDSFARYEPVFRAFEAAAASDAPLAGGSRRVMERNQALFQAKLPDLALPPRQLDPVVAVLLAGIIRSLDIAAVLRSVEPEAVARDRIEVAITDVVHRALFGLAVGVNARQEVLAPLPALTIGTRLQQAIERAEQVERESVEPGRRALASLLEVGHDVVARRGPHGTRVEDVVTAAQVSRGAFYRYFANKDDLVQVVAVRALTELESVLGSVPSSPDDRAAVRRWLRRYQQTHATNGALVRVWIESTLGHAVDGADQAAALDVGRRRMLRLLRGREVGDDDAEALVLLAIVDSFGAMPADDVNVDAVDLVIQRAAGSGASAGPERRAQASGRR